METHNPMRLLNSPFLITRDLEVNNPATCQSQLLYLLKSRHQIAERASSAGNSGHDHAPHNSYAKQNIEE